MKSCDTCPKMKCKKQFSDNGVKVKKSELRQRSENLLPSIMVALDGGVGEEIAICMYYL